jgi:hypothetical protein
MRMAPSSHAVPRPPQRNQLPEQPLSRVVAAAVYLVGKPDPAYPAITGIDG